MIHERQQEEASLYALGALADGERDAFERELKANAELRQLVRELQGATGLLAKSVPQMTPPAELRGKVLRKIQSQGPGAQPPVSIPAGLHFRDASDPSGWKELPVPGAYIKLLSIDRERGYAVVLGKLNPGVRYPAHVNEGAEDLCILSGDLSIGDRRLGPGDFHRAEAGSYHDVNYSVEGCTLIAVLTAEHPLVALAMS